MVKEVNKFNLYQRVRFKDGEHDDTMLVVIAIVGSYGRNQEVLYDLAEFVDGEYRPLPGTSFHLVFENVLEAVPLKE